jgi:putative flippase GtrA
MQSEIARYIVNGAVATIVHYSILTINIEVIGISSAGLANFIAAIFGITVS